MLLYTIFVWAVLMAAVRLASARAVRKITPPNYALYHSESALMDSVKLLVESDPLVQLDMISHTAGNYTAEVPVVTFEPGKRAEGEVLRVLLDFGEHAREFISADTGLHLLKLLVNRHMLTAQFNSREWIAGDTNSTAELAEFLDCCVELKVIPMENREGRKRIESKGDLCERKNGNGVDPNRNWEVDWGKREADYSAYEENAGTGPFSEPEAYILRNLVQEFRPHVWVNVHSGMDGLFMPYDHIAQIPDTPDSQHTLDILQKLNRQVCKRKCTVGSGGKSVGYLAHGTATDYMYDKANVSIAMTWEIYGDQTADFHDCFKMFNPVTKAGYRSILETWTNGIFQLLLHVRGHPSVSHLTLSPAASVDSQAYVQPTVPADSLNDAGSRAEPVVNDTVPDTPWTKHTAVWERQSNSTVTPVLQDARTFEQSLWMRVVLVMFIFTVGLWFVLRRAFGQKRRKRASLR